MMVNDFQKIEMICFFSLTENNVMFYEIPAVRGDSLVEVQAKQISSYFTGFSQDHFASFTFCQQENQQDYMRIKSLSPSKLLL